VPHPLRIQSHLSLLLALTLPIGAGAQVPELGQIIQRPPLEIDTAGLWPKWASGVSSWDSVAIYRAVLSAGLDTILNDSPSVKRLVYLDAEYPAQLGASVLQWQDHRTGRRYCSVARRHDCPPKTPRSLDLHALQVVTADSVEVPFEVDTHRKAIVAWVGPPPIWSVLRAWEMGMFLPIGEGPVGGCLDLLDNGRYLTLVRDGATWRVLTIGSGSFSFGKLCA
jgi:hypothetical protein